MAFTSWAPGPDLPGTARQQVYTADATGGNVTLLTPEAWVRATPVWSPRQDWIALIVNAKEEYGDASIRLVE